MPICIECSYPVSHLYSAYSRADDRSQGKGVRLTQCPRCQRFADKYVEYDFVVIFIDLVLIKPQVYRHLLFNRLGRDDNRFDRSIVRLGILLLLFDVYLTWARLEKDPSLATTFIARAPIVVQYLFFLTLNAAATLAHHLTVRLLASMLVPQSHRYGAPETSTNQPATTATTGDTTPFPSGPPTPTIRPSPPSQANHAAQQLFSLGLPAAKLTPNPLFPNDTTSPPDPSMTTQSQQALPPQGPPPPLPPHIHSPNPKHPTPPPTNSRKSNSNQHRPASKQLRKALPHSPRNLGRRRQRQRERNHQHNRIREYIPQRHRRLESRTILIRSRRRVLAGAVRVISRCGGGLIAAVFADAVCVGVI
ncbi:uncharacterized protein N7473_001328 [Penicillium subrubescens]|uniref:uncharacterized protein n=1 Tax=Penicillium subrubescens TaxID=1316194 RepID=UPI002544DF38|nr:uncharacterized protein N7473_001328 [Penicillium subrubescens]KAJ5912025.1 hypothetical protein N7473_001328 [Penicillium subrubescens]